MNFLEAQSCLLVFLMKRLGFFSYAINSDGAFVERRRSNWIYSIAFNLCSHFAFIGIHLLFIRQIDDFLGDNNRITVLVTMLEGGTIELSWFIIVYSIFLRRDSQISFIRRLVELEREVEGMKFSNQCYEYNKSLRINSLRFITVQVIFHVGFLCFYAAIIPSKVFIVFLSETFLYVIYAITLIFITHFLDNLVRTLGNLFVEINRNLDYCIQTNPMHFHNADLLKIFSVHDRVVQSIAMFNKSFGVLVLAVFMFVFGIITFELYFAIAASFNGVAPLDMSLLPSVIGNVLSFSPILITICRLGTTCRQVREKVNIFHVKNLRKSAFKPFQASLLAASLKGAQLDSCTSCTKRTVWRLKFPSFHLISRGIELHTFLFNSRICFRFNRFIAFSCTRCKWKRISPPTIYSLSTMQLPTM